MVDGLDRTDKMIENMQGQLTSMENQEKAMRDQVRIMGDALMITNRAYVGIHTLREDWERNRIVLLIENTGNTPADYVRTTGSVLAIRFHGSLRNRRLEKGETDYSVYAPPVKTNYLECLLFT